MAARSGSARGAKGKKRPGDQTSSSEEPPPKRGFISRTVGGALGMARSALGSSATPSPPAPPTRTPTSVTVPEINLPPVPDDPEGRAAYISNCVDLMAAKRAEIEQETKFQNSPRTRNFNVNINPHDKAWIDKRQRFVNDLKVNTNTPMDVFNKDFDSVQYLYFMPPENDGIILDIQIEHAKEYKAAIGPTGRFRGVPDNLATKLTMLYFGLPIEPVTMKNVENCSKEDDKSDDADPTAPPPNIQRIMWAEKPLEFLDKYGDGRSYGFPKLRIAKRRDLQPPILTQAGGLPANPNGKTPSGPKGGEPPGGDPPDAPLPPVPGSSFQNKPATGGPAQAVPRATNTPSGNGGDTAPISTAPVATAETTPEVIVTPSHIERGSHRGRGHHQIHRHEGHINPGRFTVSMRGGAGSAVELAAGNAAPPTKKRIYGYNGNFQTSNTKGAFLKTALRLLEYDFDRKPDYIFYVDLYSSGSRTRPADTTLTVKTNNFDTQFEKIKPLLNELDDQKVAIFIRAGGVPVPDEAPLEPCPVNMKETIRITAEDGNTSYWKIPKSLLHKDLHEPDTDPSLVTQYGINQCQPAFFRAMKLLLDPELARPLGSVFLNIVNVAYPSYALGFGGVEATTELWRVVRDRVAKLTPKTLEFLEFELKIRPGHGQRDGEIGGHLTGSYHESTAKITDYPKIYDEIVAMSKNYFPGKEVAELVRIWHNAESREHDGLSRKIELKDELKAIEALKAHMGLGNFDTNCILWRPEFNVFNIESLDNQKQAKWETDKNRNGLRHFKRITKSLSDDEKELESFILVEGQSADHERRFVVTRDTTEDAWRMFIYDWLHTKDVYISKCEKPIPYVLSQVPAYGVSSPIVPIVKKVPVTPVSTKTTPAATASTTRPLSGTIKKTRINRERIVAAAAGKPKSQTWSDWMTEQHFQDGLQRKSWLRDQSVIEPGRMPAPPLFGPSRELQMRIGPSMPTIYAQRLTPTDIKQLQDENQKLRNQVLDRMHACPICNDTFESYEKDKIKEHMLKHQKQLQEVGQCPSCGDTQWSFMTAREKRIHFATHQSHNEGTKIKQFYQDQNCPVCDRDLSKVTPERVIRHCLDHAPGQIRYCDRCGLDEKDCNTEELRHHHHRCRLAKDRYEWDPEPIICKNCGLNITKATADDNLKHQKSCSEGSKGRFCEKCGLNMDDPQWTQAAVDKHDSHCMAPSGTKRKFCEKCRTEVMNLDAIGRSHHQQTCRRVEPPVTSEQIRITELKQRQELAGQMEARLNSRQAYIAVRDEDQDARERYLVQRKKSMDDQQKTINDLAIQVEALKRVQDAGTSDAAGPPLDSFPCPLKTATGETCNQHISLKNNGFQLTVHYAHKFSAEERADIKKAYETMGDFARLRAKVLEAQPQHQDNISFINQRKDGSAAAWKEPPVDHPVDESPPEEKDDVDAALTRVGVTQARARAIIDARRRRPSLTLQGYRDLGDETNSGEASEEIEVEPEPKKKGRPAKAAPAKVTPVASKKRKQVELEEEEAPAISKKSLRTPAVSPANKKQKKAADAVLVQTPANKIASPAMSSATPAKKAGRPKSKVKQKEVVVKAKTTAAPFKVVKRTRAKT